MEPSDSAAPTSSPAPTTRKTSIKIRRTGQEQQQEHAGLPTTAATKLQIKTVRTTSKDVEGTSSLTITPPSPNEVEEPPSATSVHRMTLRTRATVPTSPSVPRRQQAKPRAKRKRSPQPVPEDKPVVDQPNTPAVKGKHSMWWDPAKPNIAHHQYTVDPSRTLKSFVAPPEARGHAVKFFPLGGDSPAAAAAKKPSRGYVARWKVDATLPRVVVVAGAAAETSSPSSSSSGRKYKFRVRGVGQVRRPPARPRVTCEVTCHASPCPDADAPLLPPEAEGRDVAYYVGGDGPFATPPWDTRPACRMVWTVPGTKDDADGAPPAKVKRPRVDAEARPWYREWPSPM